MGAKVASQKLAIRDDNSNNRYEGNYDNQTQMEDGSRLLLRDSLSLFQNGIRADLRIQCGDTVWEVHRAVVLDRSNYLRIEFDERDGRTKKNVLELKPEAHQSHIIDSYLLWLYTRSFKLVVDNITMSSDQDNGLHAFMDLFEFAVHTNIARRGLDGIEKDNDGLIKDLTEKISHLFKEDIENLVRSNINRSECQWREPETYVQSFQKLYQMHDEKNGERISPVTALQREVVKHVAYWGDHLRVSLQGRWKDLEDRCPALFEQLLDHYMNSVDISGLTGLYSDVDDY